MPTEGIAGIVMRCVPAQIDIEDFRVVTESYGMQLNDDCILAIFSKVRADEDLLPDMLCSCQATYSCVDSMTHKPIDA